MRIGTDDVPLLADESAHPASAMERWFVQGYYEGVRARHASVGQAGGRRHFMSTLFRQNVSRDPSPPQNGFSLLLSVLDPATARKENLCQVDPGVVDLFVRLGREMPQTSLDPHVLEAYVSEVAAYGPPRPIRCERARAELTANPFSAVWQDFSLGQSKEAFHLSFAEPESGRVCRFDLRPSHSRMHIEGIEILDATTMDYVAYPCLELTGTAGDERVTGTAWLAHEWGNAGWFVAQRAEARVLGWDWFRINLDDGSDLLVMVHRDMKDRTPIARYVVMLEKGRQARVCHDFTATPLRHWESKATHVRYPVAWRIEVPEFDIALTFEPLADDQEIQVFGIMRAIWEGAGTVSGRAAGRPAAGRARLELRGYGCILDYRHYLERWVERIDRRIEEYLPKAIDNAETRRYAGVSQWKHEASTYAAMLSEPIWDLLSRKGKHWRPIFGLLMLEALGTPSEPYEMLVSVASELPHTGALIIDDIEDNSRIRRGDESIHLRYGLDVAISAANTIYFLPFPLVERQPDLSSRQRLEIYQIVTGHFIRGHFGQSQDIYWSRNMTVEYLARWMDDSLGQRILQAYADKTASLVEATAEASCVIAQSDKATRQACVAFARRFGVAFQIMDDVLNFADSPERVKLCGQDIAEGKLTYVILRALERLKAPQSRRLQTILCSKSLRRKLPVLREAIGLVRSSGALASCGQEARAMMAEEWGRLSEMLPSSEPKMMLHALCTGLLNIANET